MATVNIRGDIITDEDKWFYDFFGMASTSPKDVYDAISSATDGEMIDVIINSGGGSVVAGQEIYSLLFGNNNVRIKIQSIAASAAAVIAMAGVSEMSPVSMLMVHNVQAVGVSGDYREMQKEARILKQMNAALASAFTVKSKKPLDEVLKMMDNETWLTAADCLEMGLVDSISENEAATAANAVNAYGGMWLTDEKREEAKRLAAERKAKEDGASEETIAELETPNISDSLSEKKSEALRKLNEYGLKAHKRKEQEHEQENA